MWVLRLPPVSTRDCRLNSSTISLMNEEEVKSCFVSLESDGSKIEFFHKYLVMSIFPCIWHSSRCATPNLIEIVQQNADDHRQNVKSRGQPIPSYPASRPRLVLPDLLCEIFFVRRMDGTLRTTSSGIDKQNTYLPRSRN